jgi:hypothetical protein
LYESALQGVGAAAPGGQKVPGGHSAQLAARASGACVPLAQGVHASCPGPEKLPGAQGTSGAVRFMDAQALPAVQSSQAVALKAGLKVRGSQAWQALAPWREKEPGGHTAGSVACGGVSAHAEPAGQGATRVAPSASMAEPGGQKVPLVGAQALQAPAPCPLAVPAGQGAGRAPPPAQDAPGGQGVATATSAGVPSPQKAPGTAAVHARGSAAPPVQKDPGGQATPPLALAVPLAHHVPGAVAQGAHTLALRAATWALKSPAPHRVQAEAAAGAQVPGAQAAGSAPAAPAQACPAGQGVAGVASRAPASQ